MKAICANCEKVTEVEVIRTEENVAVRGENVTVEAEYTRCTECGETAENTRGYDALAVAYREYRKRHGMMQPDEIREWRKSCGLTQRELSALLGWGGATLSRYENGALQEEAHDKLLRLAREPHNLLHLVQETPHLLSDEKRNRLVSELTAAEAESCSLSRVFEERFGRYPADEFSGYRKVDLGKFFQAVLFFCRDGQLKTKLNKLLFYADFKHFKENSVSITGSRYAHLPHGPVADNYEHYFAELVSEGRLTTDEVMVFNYIGDQLSTVGNIDLGLFSDSELKVLTEVKEKFKNFSAKEIRDFSHEEPGYQSTRNGELISYRYAESLRI